VRARTPENLGALQEAEERLSQGLRPPIRATTRMYTNFLPSRE